MVFSYYNRLSATRRRIYRASDAIAPPVLKVNAQVSQLIGLIEQELAAERRAKVQSACQALLDALTAQLHVPPLKVKVYAARPAHDWGELHGLYEPQDDAPALISVWMRTAARKQVVAFRSFLRTLIHELCHHLDYELFQLEETFHTEGFYRREAGFVRQLLGSSPTPAVAPEPESKPALPNGVTRDEMFAQLKAIVAKGKA